MSSLPDGDCQILADVHKGDGMNGVNPKATGGLRVMNGAMTQYRSIEDFSFQASTHPCGLPLYS
jgi:hypothetical protein